MRIAVLGGGITGLSAAFYLSVRGHEIVVFEKEKILGGLASGFRTEGWDWPLEKAYHHLFANDDDVLGLDRQTGLNKIYFSSPETSSLVAESNGMYGLYPFDTPLDFLKFPHLSMREKIRTGASLTFLKAVPFMHFFETTTAKAYLKKTMGEQVWENLWKDLFDKKFGKYADDVMASFIWARIKKRTKKLGYIKGGFQAFIDGMERVVKQRGVKVLKRKDVSHVRKEGKDYYVDSKKFGAIVATLPTPVIVKVASSIFPNSYLDRLKGINYLHATTLILETKEPLFEKSYWINILARNLPITVLIQHTNFVDKKYYGDKHILYIGNYVDKNSQLLTMNKREALKHFTPYLKKINSVFQPSSSSTFYFKGSFAQPIFDRDFLMRKPEFITPAKNFFISNLDMTYPYDRGTNYAVKLGREVSEIIS